MRVTARRRPLRAVGPQPRRTRPARVGMRQRQSAAGAAGMHRAHQAGAAWGRLFFFAADPRPMRERKGSGRACPANPACPAAPAIFLRPGRFCCVWDDEDTTRKSLHDGGPALAIGCYHLDVIILQGFFCLCSWYTIQISCFLLDTRFMLHSLGVVTGAVRKTREISAGCCGIDFA